MKRLDTVYRNPRDLKNNPRNARTHSAAQIKKLESSILAFGFTNPVLIDEDDTLIAGHGRLAAALQLGLAHIPSIKITGLSGVEKRALMLMDNRLALDAGWDEDKLAIELSDLSSLDLDFDVTLTGFDTPEIDMIIDSVSTDGSNGEAECIPEACPDILPITRQGDLWKLGQHLVLCGNARSDDHLALLLGDEQASALITDPPYNVRVKGHVGGKGRTRHREFDEASGEMDSAAFTEFLSISLGNAARHCRPGAVAFTFMDWRHTQELQLAAKTVFGRQLNLCVWVKTNGGMGSLYRSQHELVFVHRVGKVGHRNNVQLGRHGRNRTNVWRYPGVNTFRPGRMDELRAHPTAKPVALIYDALLDVTAHGEIVVDPFLGAGATLMAAERSGRIARGLEIDPVYVDTAIRRWRDKTGKEPVRMADRMTLGQLEQNQTGEASDAQA